MASSLALVSRESGGAVAKCLAIQACAGGDLTSCSRDGLLPRVDAMSCGLPGPVSGGAAYPSILPVEPSWSTMAVCTCDLTLSLRTHVCSLHPDGPPDEGGYWELRYEWGPRPGETHGSRGVYHYFDEDQARTRLHNLEVLAQAIGMTLKTKLTEVRA